MQKAVTLSFSIILASIFPISAFAGPDIVEPASDAGNSIATAEPVNSTFSTLNSISGVLEGLATPRAVGPTGGDFEDMYIFRISDPATFSATTVTNQGGFADFNTELFLFNAAGRGVLANDDFNGNFQSRLPNAANDGSGAVVMEPGIYFLAITGSNNNPTDAEGPGGEIIFNQADPNEVSGPDGPGGGNVQQGWDNTGGGEIGEYTIALTGSAPLDSIPTVSEWGLIVMTLLLLTAGTIVFGRRRQRPAAV